MTDKTRVSRRRLLGGAVLAFGGLTGLGTALRAIGGTLPSSAAGADRPIDLGPLDAFPEGRFVVATFLSDPGAGEVSRRAAYVRNNGVVRGRPSFTIMSSRCTHVGCPTQPNGPLLSRQQRMERGANGEIGLVPTLATAGFGCPCHGSQFDTEGNRTAGPAPRALDRYEFSLRDGRLQLGPIYSVGNVEGAGSTAKIKRFGRLGAGVPATRPESLLYPVDPLS